MAAKANPIPQLPAPRKAVTAVSTETEQEAGLSVCLFVLMLVHAHPAVCLSRSPAVSFCPLLPRHTFSL